MNNHVRPILYGVVLGLGSALLTWAIVWFGGVYLLSALWF